MAEIASLSDRPAVQTRTLDHYWQLLARRRAVVFLTTIAAVVTAFAASKLIDPRYDARSQFYVVDASDSGGGLLGASAGSVIPSVFLPSTAEAVVTSHIGILQTDAVRKRVHERSPKKPLAQLESDVDVLAAKKYLLSVRVWDTDPTVAAQVANAYPIALNDFLRTVAAERALNVLRATQQSRAELQMRLQAARNNLQAMFDREKTPSIRREIDDLVTRKSNLESSLQTAEARQWGIEQRIALAEEQLKHEAQASMTVLGAQSSATVQRLMKEVSDLDAELIGARTEFDGKQGERHPRVKALVAQRSMKQRELDQENAHLQKSDVKPPGSFYEQSRRELMGQYKNRAAAKAEIAQTRVALSRLLTRIDRQQTGLSLEAELSGEVLRLDKMVDALSFTISSSEIQAASRSDLVVVLSDAKVATEAKIPAPLFNALIAAVLGLIGGVYLAFAYDWLLGARALRDDARAAGSQLR